MDETFKKSVQQLGGDLPFTFEVPVSFFEKADAGVGRTRRIGGVISTESRDRQNEIVLQKGLCFKDFMAHGWFNDNHSKDTDGILGYPERVKYFAKGSKLPDGRTADSAGHWAEGYLLDTQRGTKIWELGSALQKSGRRLGFSIEGRVEKRIPKKNIIAKAKVQNVAITNCPVNLDSRLEVLAKSLRAVEAQALKSLSAGNSPTDPVGPVSGEGAGQVLIPESLETGNKQLSLLDDDEKKKKKKMLSKAEAIAYLRMRCPGISDQIAKGVINATHVLQNQGRI